MLATAHPAPFVPTHENPHRILTFDRKEQPVRATLRTRLGPVKVVWRDVCGDRCWFTSGILDAKKLAVPAIERIERMVSQL